MNENGVLSFQLTPIVEEGLHAPHLVDYANTLGPASRGALEVFENAQLWNILIPALMVTHMGTQSTHTKFGASRPHQFFGAGPQSFTI